MYAFLRPARSERQAKAGMHFRCKRFERKKSCNVYKRKSYLSGISKNTRANCKNYLGDNLNYRRDSLKYVRDNLKGLKYNIFQKKESPVPNTF